jgi:hypothetical protein
MGLPLSIWLLLAVVVEREIILTQAVAVALAGCLRLLVKQSLPSLTQ